MIAMWSSWTLMLGIEQLVSERMPPMSGLRFTSHRPIKVGQKTLFRSTEISRFS